MTWNLSWPAIIVRARLVSIGRQYEEAAADLGASRLEAIRRVLLPMLAPAIFASAVLVFSGVIDDFVLVDLLSSSAATQPMSVIIYSNTHGGNGGPALNALATLMLLFSFFVAIIGYLGYRWMTRGERSSRRRVDGELRRHLAAGGRFSPEDSALTRWPRSSRRGSTRSACAGRCTLHRGALAKADGGVLTGDLGLQRRAGGEPDVDLGRGSEEHAALRPSRARGCRRGCRAARA